MPTTDIDPLEFLPKLLRQTEARAKRAGIAFRLTRTDLIAMWVHAQGKCELTGVSFSGYRPPSGEKRPFMPSVDRVNPAADYTPGNCRLVCVIANVMKWDWDERTCCLFIRMVREAATIPNAAAPAWNDPEWYSEGGVEARFQLPCGTLRTASKSGDGPACREILRGASLPRRVYRLSDVAWWCETHSVPYSPRDEDACLFEISIGRRSPVDEISKLRDENRTLLVKYLRLRDDTAVWRQGAGKRKRVDDSRAPRIAGSSGGEDRWR